MNRIRKNYISNIIFQTVRLITPLITTPYVSRVLGVNNIGIFSYSYSLQSYFCLVAVLGTTTYGAREIARCRDDKKEVSIKFWEIELLTIFTSFASICGWILVIVIHPENRVLYILLTSYLLASMLDISWIYMGLEMFPYIVMRNIFVRLAEVAAIFTFVKSERDLPVYCAIMGGATLLGNATLWINIKRIVVYIPVQNLKPWKHFKYTLTFFLPTIATTIYTVLDKTLIGMITKSSYENGCYEQATKVIEIAKAITFTSLNTVLSPRSSYLFVHGQYEKIKKNLKVSLEFMLALGVGFAFGIAGTAGQFVPVFFGAGYEGVVRLLQLLSPIIVIITISNALDTQYYNPAGLRLKSSKYLFIGAFCNFIMNLILIPHLASRGAVIASVIAEAVIAALYLKNCCGYLHPKEIIEILHKKLIAGGVMLFVSWLITQRIETTLLALAIQVAIVGSSYLLTLLILKDRAVKYVLTELLRKK